MGIGNKPEAVTPELKTAYTRLDAGEISVAEAVKVLVSLGHSQFIAEEAVFIHLGGGDLVSIDGKGVKRYAISGKTCAEVDKLMRRKRSR